MRQEKWRSFKSERDSIAKSTDKTERGSHVGKIKLQCRLNIWSESRFLVLTTYRNTFLASRSKRDSCTFLFIKIPTAGFRGTRGNFSVWWHIVEKYASFTMIKFIKNMNNVETERNNIFSLLYCFLGAFAKLEWVITSFVVSVRLSVRPCA